MTLTRRDFSASLIGAGLGTTLAGAALAQSAPTEGVNYVRLADAVPAAAAGKIEVIEFFWYECPHCNAFEPALDAWAKKAPDDVAFRRVPVWFREEPFTVQQRLFYALEALGLVPTLHRKVFQAIHVEHVRMRTPEDLAAFALKNGVDPVKFIAACNAFSVQSKSQQARQTASAYKIDAVP
ncbi:MAG: thiol:disulfide interchange protein DsbA/DsbL, partial [Pseudomonadota bacterium]|nr:thiol:disulfide interchange protein DsbA/DsbL [Pseudomonadota bacterium]